jgi:diaminopimelate epimerase
MENKIVFYKFHGAGNDFILIDNRNQEFINLEQIKFLCVRNFGIGADGLILLENPKDEANDFAIRYFNADGREASLCGNGSRCAVALAEKLSILTNRTAQFEAVDGVHHAVIACTEKGHFWQVSLSMNAINKIEKFRRGYFLDTGSPHYVRRVSNVKKYNVEKKGKKWRYNSYFPNGTNVDFYESNVQGLFVRTYERGVEGETHSCGTGVTATALVWAKTQNLPDGAHSVKLFTNGGDFQVKFEKNGKEFKQIQLLGPVKFVFKGEIVI